MAEIVLDGEATTLDVSSLALSRFDAPPEQVEYNVV
jgi:hypothetical protein